MAVFVMRTVAALPEHFPADAGTILTFVVPAPNGCDLACPFCYINQRKESAVCLNSPEQVPGLIADIVEEEEISAIYIQGYEPPFPLSGAYACAIFRTGQYLGIPTRLVTKRVYLGRWIDELAGFGSNKFSVRLDLAYAEVHDDQRRSSGAFDATVQRLRSAAGWSWGKANRFIDSFLIALGPICAGAIAWPLLGEQVKELVSPILLWFGQ